MKRGEKNVACDEYGETNILVETLQGNKSIERSR
jgi:hypothetical protein